MTDPPAPRLARFDARTTLLETGATLFAARGFDAMGTRALSSAAGVNISAIRYHFGSKEGYYQAVLEHLMREIELALGPALSALREAAARGSDALLPEVEAFLDGWCDTVLLDERTQRRMPFVLRELLPSSPHFEIVWRHFFRPLVDTFTVVIAAARPSLTNQMALAIEAHALTNQLLGFVTTERVLWRQLDWVGYDGDKVAVLRPRMLALFAHVLDLD